MYTLLARFTKQGLYRLTGYAGKPDGQSGCMADRDPDLVLYPESPMPLYLQLAREMRAHICRSRLSAGAALPSVPALAEQLGLSRDTVTKAYVLLRDVGTIKARHGVGWFVTKAIPPVYVAIEPGSEVCTRPIRPTDVDAIKDDRVALMASALVIETPGRRPVAYDAMRTVAR